VNITISGGSGLIGRRLLKLLGSDGHTLRVLSRHAGTNLPAGVALSVWDATRGEPPAESLQEADAVIHLSGESVAQRWTDAARSRIRETRVVGTESLVRALAKLPRRPQALVCASAIGYYGSRGDETLTEASPPGSGFLSELCQEWEKAARQAEELGIRVALIRIGVVLDPRGGALGKMLPPFKMGLGGKLGDGRQWMSWIHAGDLANLFRFAVLNPVAGPMNGVSPVAVTNADFTRALAAALHRPAIFPVPRPALQLLLGEMADMLLASQRVLPQAAELSGFRFQFPHLDNALSDLLK